MKSQEKMKYQGRLLLFYGILIAMITTLLGAVGYRQLIETEQFSEQVKVQNHRRIVTPAPRGHIFDREGRLLVANASKFSAVVFLSDASVRAAFRNEYRTLVRDHRREGTKYDTGQLQKQARANVIQSYLNDVNRMLGREEEVNAERVSTHLNYNPLLPFPIINDLTREEFAILLESLPVESPVQVYVTNMRHYPYEATASHTLGYVVSTFLTPDEGLPGEDLTTFAEKGTFGRSGVERQFDDILQGKMGMEIWVVDPSGFQVESVERRYPTKGKDIQLSLDIDLQVAAEEAFGDQVGGLVAIDIETLEVLALVSKPDYDLNDTTPFISQEVFDSINDSGGWQNRALQGLYPPGSPFKLLTAIAALKAGKADTEEEHICEGYLRVAGAMKPCWKRSGHGPRSLRGAIRDSCNVYFYEVALETGIDTISREAIYMGLGDPTDIDLPHETRHMLVPTKEWKKERTNEPWYPGDTTNAAIGQGFLRVTPLQMALFMASIAKNEVVSNPSILKLTPSQIANRPPPKPLGLSEEDHAAIVQGMAQAIQLGTGKLAKIDGVDMAGKTGTAQVRKDGGTIEIAWFTAFAPVDDPKIAVVVAIEGQQLNVNFGGGAHSAPVAKAVFEEYFRKHSEFVPARPAAKTTAAR